ncbi:MAG: enoyl-CoA hydratase/isomerase family protein [Chloroflexota bacterium]
MQFEALKIEIDGPLGILTLNRPDRLNALGKTILKELAEAARWFDEQMAVRVVIIRGEGRAFCAGADLKDPAIVPHEDWIMRREMAHYGLRMADAIEGMRAVTIAQVHGYAVGGGIVLMAACDIRVVADDTVLFIPEVELGIPLAWGGIPRLVREIGPALTKELVMTCRRFTPTEAKAAGFVNRVVSAQEVVTEARSLAESLLEMPSVPLIITKEHVNSVARAMSAGSTSFSDGDALLSTMGDPGSQEARQRYVQKAIGKK